MGDDFEFSSKPSSFKEIVMEHLKRITQLSCVEFRGGYYNSFKTKQAEIHETYVPDSREVLSNAIYCMAQLLILKFDKEMTPAFEQFNKDRLELKRKFLDSTKSLEETEVLGEGFYNDDEKILLEEYKIQKIVIYLDLFTELSKLLARKKYFEIGGASFG